MCGIAGAVGFADESVVDAVHRMNGAMQHRGPDAEGIWQDIDPATRNGVVLGHRRLSIIDLSEAANQPMVDSTIGNAISYNGEIYNFAELRSELRGAGIEFATQSDTEVVLKAYGHWGADCVRRFRGMFAFAIWDARRKNLSLARDPVGIKPLYLARTSRSGGRRTLFFASELRALLETGLVERRADPVGIETYLWNGFVVGPGTMVTGIDAFPAGVIAGFDRTGEASERRSYWEVPSFDSSIGRVDSVAENLEDAVRMRLVIDVPLGVFLSGGVDSSAIVNLAVRSGASRIRTFNIGFEETEFDESTYARSIADQLGTEHYEVRLSEARFGDQLPDALASLDQPTFDAINTYFVSRAAREAGITVALAGTGGDELFGGYRSFKDVPRAMRWSQRLERVPAPVLRAAAALVARMMSGRAGPVPPQTRWGKLGDALATRGDLVKLYQASYGMFSEAFLAMLWERSSGPPVISGLPSPRFEYFSHRIAGSPPLHAIAMLELSLFVSERLLRDTDTTSMAVSLEVRVPLLDHRVIEAASGLAERERFLPLGRKEVLRKHALEGLDPSLFERPKSGFVLPFDRWCRQRLRNDVAEILEDATRCESIGLRPEAVRRLWKAFSMKSPGIYWSRIWALFVLLDWTRRHRVQL